MKEGGHCKRKKKILYQRCFNYCNNTGAKKLLADGDIMLVLAISDEIIAIIGVFKANVGLITTQLLSSDSDMHTLHVVL